MGSPNDSRRSAVLVGKKIDPTLHARVRAGESARVDYLEFVDRYNAELLDFKSVEQSTHPLVRMLNARFNPYYALAALATVRRNEFDRIYVSGEDVGIPLAAFAQLFRDLRFSVLIHNAGTAKRQRALRLLGSHMYDRVFCLCTAQRRILVEEIGLPTSKVSQLKFYCDQNYFRPLPIPPDDYILSIGIEQRDYGTLERAAANLPYRFRVVASGWSPGSAFGAAHQIEGSTITVERNISSQALKELYAGARFIVIPLNSTSYAAGITALTEAMAMGKAVIVSAAPGVLDYVRDGSSGLLVPVGDVGALERAITQLWEDRELTERMGAHNRRWIEEEFTIEQYVTDTVRGATDGQGIMLTRGKAA